MINNVHSYKPSNSFLFSNKTKFKASPKNNWLGGNQQKSTLFQIKSWGSPRLFHVLQPLLQYLFKLPHISFLLQSESCPPQGLGKGGASVFILFQRMFPQWHQQHQQKRVKLQCAWRWQAEDVISNWPVSCVQCSIPTSQVLFKSKFSFFPLCVG